MNKSESGNKELCAPSLEHDARYLEEMGRDPNIRLSLYREACNAALLKASVYGSLAISSLWIDVLLNGVEDMWSSTRSECAECIRKLISAPAPDGVALKSPHNPSHQSSLSLLVSCSANVNQLKKGTITVKNTGSAKRGHTAKGGTASALRDDWRRQLASKLLNRWARTQSGSAGWYQREGLLRVFKTYCDFNYAFYQENLEGQLWLREVLFHVALPALHEAQLPVREEAASLLCIITQRESAVRSYVFDRVVHKLKDLVTIQKTLSTLPKDEEAQTHVVEGHLIALIKLFEQDPRSGRKESTYQLLMRYASYQASSVRQYVAEALCPPSEVLCIRLLKELSIRSRWSSSNVQNRWQEGETVLMALQRHLLHYLDQEKGYKFNLERLISVATGECPARFLHRCFESLLDASCAFRFELSRMGQQVIPLLLQLWVRFASTAKVVLKVVQELTVSNARTTRSGGGIPLEHPSLAQPDRCRILDELIVPLLWWYLAVRRATTITDAQENRKKLEEVHVDHFFHTLQGSNSKVKGPMYSTVVLIIGCYFLPLLGENDNDIVQEILLDNQTWENILQTPLAMPYLHFGIDFVSSMKCRGKDLQHLVPVWLNALEGAQTHQQCILARMVREVLCFSDATSQHVSRKACGSVLPQPFCFAYNDIFAAPAMLDGGEEMTLGYTWLKKYFPTQQEIPPGEVFFGTAVGSRADSEDLEKQKAVVDALKRFVCNGLYLSPVIEPEILREARSLMVAMVKAYPRQQCCESVLESLLMRLDCVCPQWGSKERITTHQKQRACDWDAWSEDNVGSGLVEGISIEEEIRDASHTAAKIMGKMTPDAKESILKNFGNRLVNLLC